MDYRIYHTGMAVQALQHARRNKKRIIIDTVDENKTRKSCHEIDLNLRYIREGKFEATT